MLALEGKQLGNYDVIRRIRAGGMGAVYEGRQRTAFGRRVAIKVILGDYAADPDMRRRFEREARVVARLHHPHILPLIEFGDKQGLLYLVMPFIEGGTLTSYLHRGLPDLSEISAIYLQLLDAVEYAHEEGLIHRDIKSSNVLLEPRRSGTPHVYLADFGLVRMSQQVQPEGRPIPLDQVPGTPYYMAPEQTRGIVTTVTDIYALGVLLYQMLTGELPYDDPDEIKVIQMHLHAPVPSPCDHDVSIPVELGEVIRTAMAKHAEDRFQNIAELRNAFVVAAGGLAGNGQQTIPREELRPLDEPNSFTGRPVASSRPLRGPVPVAVRRRSPPKRLVAAVPVRRAQQPQLARSTQNRRKRFTLPMMAAAVLPTVLLILLIMPRVLGFSFFPAGFPVLGTPAVATITVTAQSKTIQNTYLLTASPQATSPDLTSRVIPERQISAVASDTRIARSSGTKDVSGEQATGFVHLVNTSPIAISVPEGTIFTTDSGVQVRLTESVEVPSSSTATAPALAVSPGAAGNIPAGALDMTCCNGIFVTNQQPFTGGTDGQVQHVLAQSDLDGVKAALSARLQQQALQQLQRQLAANEAIAGTPTYKTVVSSNVPVGSQVGQAQVQVSVSVTAFVYNRYTASHMAAQLLSAEAMQTLGNNYQLQGTPFVAMPRMVQQGKNGLVYLSVAARGLWAYYFPAQQLNQWSLSIKGATPALALAYLNAQPGVVAVRIQLPFGTDHLPTSVDQIKFVLVNQAS